MSSALGRQFRRAAQAPPSSGRPLLDSTGRFMVHPHMPLSSVRGKRSFQGPRLRPDLDAENFQRNVGARSTRSPRSPLRRASTLSPFSLSRLESILGIEIFQSSFGCSCSIERGERRSLFQKGSLKSEWECSSVCICDSRVEMYLYRNVYIYVCVRLLILIIIRISIRPTDERDVFELKMRVRQRAGIIISACFAYPRIRDGFRSGPTALEDSIVRDSPRCC